jgi:DNA invertase Pin-like site-specific DNA recombinase
MKQAIIYTRFSPRPDADECESIEKQMNRCRAHCIRSGYIEDQAFQDPKVSGGILNRPGLQAALKALGSDTVLVVDSSDRLARDMLVNLTIRHEVEKAGATIEFADGSPTPTTPEGELFQNILAAFAAYERSRIRRNTKRGLAKKRKNGERTTGKIPIGEMLDPGDPKRTVRCESEWMAIKVMCKWSGWKWSSKKIAKRLKNVVGPCRGGAWSPRTVRRLINRHSYWAGPNGDPSLEPTHP